MKVELYDIHDDHALKYVVIASRHQGQWLMVKHRARETWEIPGGHIEMGESPDAAALRELYEETGAQTRKLVPVKDYSVTRQGQTSFGRLYLAEVASLDRLPPSEIECVKPLDDQMVWTYAAIQPILFRAIQDYDE